MVPAQKCQSDGAPAQQFANVDAQSAEPAVVEIEPAKAPPPGVQKNVRNPFSFLYIGRRRVRSLRISGPLFETSNAGTLVGDRLNSWRGLLLPSDLARMTATLRFVRREIRNLRKSGDWPSKSEVMQIPEVDEAFFTEYMKGNHAKKS